MAPPRPLDSRCDVFRPFGAAAPVYSNVPCRVVPQLMLGRGGAVGTTYLMWTHYLDFSADDDIRDGCSRAAGTNYITYNDGDGLRVVSGGVTQYFVVVWVEHRYPDSEQRYIRAYCVRDGISP